MKMHKIISQDCENIANAKLPWESLQGKTVLISGANGYVPAYFVYSLLTRNELFNSKIKVIALCRNEKKAKERFSEFLKRKDFNLLIQDACEPIRLKEPVHFFIAAASPAGMPESSAKPVDTFLTNVKGCYNILEFAKKNKDSKVLFLSSIDANYGLDIYSNSKKSAEWLCQAYAKQYETDVKIARPVQIIGAGIDLNSSRLSSNFILQLLQTGKISLKTDGKAERAFIYISDAILGMFFVLLKGKSSEIYDICSEKGNASVLELAKLFAGNVAVKVGKQATKSPPSVTGNSAKLRKLGWKPSIDLSNGILRIKQFYGV
jgi:nucleoside-diphosphate-sugar epimerase